MLEAWKRTCLLLPYVSRRISDNINGETPTYIPRVFPFGSYIPLISRMIRDLNFEISKYSFIRDSFPVGIDALYQFVFKERTSLTLDHTLMKTFALRKKSDEINFNVLPLLRQIANIHSSDHLVGTLNISHLRFYLVVTTDKNGKSTIKVNILSFLHMPKRERRFPKKLFDLNCLFNVCKRTVSSAKLFNIDLSKSAIGRVSKMKSGYNTSSLNYAYRRVKSATTRNKSSL